MIAYNNCFKDLITTNNQSLPIAFRTERDEGDIDDVYNILESYALQVHV